MLLNHSSTCVYIKSFFSIIFFYKLLGSSHFFFKNFFQQFVNKTLECAAHLSSEKNRALFIFNWTKRCNLTLRDSKEITSNPFCYKSLLSAFLFFYEITGGFCIWRCWVMLFCGLPIYCIGFSRVDLNFSKGKHWGALSRKRY